MREFYLHFPAIALHSWRDVAIAFAIVTIVSVLSRALGHRAAASQPRAILHDAIYFGFYNSILIVAVLNVPLIRLLRPILRPIDWQILVGYPEIVRFVVFLVAADLISYWRHRLMHTRWLWPLHAVHHEQREVTAFTATRLHIGEALVSTVPMIALTAMIGNSPRDPMWFFVLRNSLAAAHHSGLRWRFGPFYWILVSPLFHSAHHAIDVEVSEHNYGGLLSVWDLLFGTHVNTFAAPPRVGVEGLSMPTLWSQFWKPLATMWADSRRAVFKRQLASADETPSGIA
jgi:sterol desaturase/sphingolipid hydroxylase (fatty acid hydroxylase superfamily)